MTHKQYTTAEIVRHYKKSRSVKRTCQDLHIGWRRCLSALDHEGWERIGKQYIKTKRAKPMANKKTYDISDEVIMKMYRQERNVRNTASYFGISREYIKTVVLRNGFEKVGTYFREKCEVKKVGKPPEANYISIIKPRPLDASLIERRLNKMPSTRCYA